LTLELIRIRHAAVTAFNDDPANEYKPTKTFEGFPLFFGGEIIETVTKDMKPVFLKIGVEEINKLRINKHPKIKALEPDESNRNTGLVILYNGHATYLRG